MVEQINILFIEDNPGDVRLVKEMLKEFEAYKINLIDVPRLSEGLKQIATQTIHVILLDLNLPDSKGIETFQQLHKFSLDTPIIILSILSNKELIYEIMLAGAHDYLIKGEIDSEALMRSIRYAMWRYHPQIMEP